MHRIHREKTVALWRSRIKECHDNGLTPSVYCQLADVSIHSFRYWSNELFGQTSHAGVDLELVHVAPTESVLPVLPFSGVHLHAEGFEIGLDRGFDEATLLRVLGVLGGKSRC